MAKQNYRCAGCGIRTDPGERLLLPTQRLQGLYRLTLRTEACQRWSERRQQSRNGKGEEGARTQKAGLGRITESEGSDFWGHVASIVYYRKSGIFGQVLGSWILPTLQGLLPRWPSEGTQQTTGPTLRVPASFGSAHKRWMEVDGAGQPSLPGLWKKNKTKQSGELP